MKSPSWAANPTVKNAVATEAGDSAGRFLRRLPTKRSMKTMATDPSAASAREFGWSVVFVLKKKPIACATLSGMYESENGWVYPGLLWSCQDVDRVSKMRAWRALWIMRTGATTTGQGRIALPSRHHTHRTIPATGTRKIGDSYRTCAS